MQCEVSYADLVLINPSPQFLIIRHAVLGNGLGRVFELKFHIWENSVKIFAFVLAGVLIIIVH